MELEEPRTQLKVRRSYIQNKEQVELELLEGEVPMSQEQQDAYKSIIGDAKAKVTVSREMGELDYGSGGKVFVAVTLTCDQSAQGLQYGIGYAAQLADQVISQHHSEMKQKCISMGILKNGAQAGRPGY